MKRKQPGAGPKVRVDSQGREYVVLSVRLDPLIKRIARHEALDAGQTISKYVEIALAERAQKSRRSPAA
jgi:predicted HicB family RNase H-like nuclease